MDVCAFAGITPRGPARVPYSDQEWIEAGLSAERARGGVAATTLVDPERPRRRSVAVPVESWDEYTRLYGRFEGPGRLPYAVAAFFEQGGRRAYVVRVVPEDAAGDSGASSGELHGLLIDNDATPLVLRARNEGSWGARLGATLAFTTRTLPLLETGASTLSVAPDAAPVPGTLLRLRLDGGIRVLRFVSALELVREPGAAAPRGLVRLHAPVSGTAATVEVVEATLELDDGDGRREHHERIALGGVHPRRLAVVLCNESELVWPDAAWADADLAPVDPSLPHLLSQPFTAVEDRYGEIVPDDFFDARWIPGDEGPAAGVHALVGVPDVSTLVVPDLYEPLRLPPIDAILDPPTLAGPWFEPCAEEDGAGTQTAEPPELEGLLLDPGDPVELERIVGCQRRLVELADVLRSFVVLLDVPPGLDQRRMVEWRAQFASSYAAAYHPWLDVMRTDDRRRTKTRVNPSAYAAAIVAHRELLFGVPYGPSNEVAARVVDVADVVSPARHDELHPLGINVFLRERDGIVLTSARTLSLDPAYRQLSVRRLMTMLARTLEQELQWVVFEPSNESLRADLRHVLRAYLRRLYRANAFAGAREQEAFFVRCDDSLNTHVGLDAGQLVAEIGVAPVEPLEFLVVRLVHDGDGTLLVEGARG
jgi:hypothetical protein